MAVDHLKIEITKKSLGKGYHGRSGDFPLFNHQRNFLCRGWVRGVCFNLENNSYLMSNHLKGRGSPREETPKTRIIHKIGQKPKGWCRPKTLLARRRGEALLQFQAA